MSASFHVEDARQKSSWMINRETRGPGDMENAMRRIAGRCGVSYSALWRLRYRKPPDIMISFYSRICEAYDEECERQRRLLEHELSISRAKTRLGQDIIGASAALVGEKGGVD